MLKKPMKKPLQTKDLGRKYITRHGQSESWQVRIIFYNDGDKVEYSKCFSDKKFGGYCNAYQKAMEYRNITIRLIETARQYFNFLEKNFKE